ncbi:MAG TPA: CBS domain-containing protein [Polyangia bacterium]|nr:CBS domain-containing protein [Polyangia bacterium]
MRIAADSIEAAGAIVIGRRVIKTSMGGSKLGASTGNMLRRQSKPRATLKPAGAGRLRARLAPVARLGAKRARFRRHGPASEPGTLPAVWPMRRQIMDVREIMTSPIQTLNPDDTLNCAARLMRDAAVGCVPIVANDGKLVGILTDRDIALSAYEYGEALWKLPVRQSMHQPVYSCHADDAIEVAAGLMRKQRVRRLPVVDAANKPIGMLSLDDLAHASRVPVIDPTPGLTADELGDAYDATSGRSKHQRSH